MYVNEIPQSVPPTSKANGMDISTKNNPVT